MGVCLGYVGKLVLARFLLQGKVVAARTQEDRIEKGEAVRTAVELSGHVVRRIVAALAFQPGDDGLQAFAVPTDSFGNGL